MTDAQVALSSGLLQVIPVLVLALFLGGRKIHPEVRQYFTAPIWPAIIVSGAAVATILAMYTLYVRTEYIAIDIVVTAAIIVLFIGLIGTVIEVAKTRELSERDRQRRATETDSTGEDTPV